MGANQRFPGAHFAFIRVLIMFQLLVFIGYSMTCWGWSVFNQAIRFSFDIASLTSQCYAVFFWRLVFSCMLCWYFPPVWDMIGFCCSDVKCLHYMILLRQLLKPSLYTLSLRQRSLFPYQPGFLLCSFVISEVYLIHCHFQMVLPTQITCTLINPAYEGFMQAFERPKVKPIVSALLQFVWTENWTDMNNFAWMFRLCCIQLPLSKIWRDQTNDLSSQAFELCYEEPDESWKLSSTWADNSSEFELRRVGCSIYK